MSVIAVVNRKGGSGKTTLATHFAAVFANAGAAVALGDIDRQQSTRVWLRHRKASGEPTRILGWNVDAKTFVREPVGIDHVVMDTPGGLTGLNLARVVMYADAIVMPISHSLFDRSAAAECLAELRTMPRVHSGRCRVAAVGMRIEPQTDAMEWLRRWTSEQKLPLIAVLPQSPAYVHSAERGLTLFDLPQLQVTDELAHWRPLLQWLRPLLQPAANVGPGTGRASGAEPVCDAPVPVVDQPKPETLSRGPRTPAPEGAAEAPAGTDSDSTETAPAAGQQRDALPLPRFLQRKP
ncbi:MAG TPA: ParA family protein [Burkholderiaceae bacterium]|nr:ParA family protein [Burkholderiaceae bacterium]